MESENRGLDLEKELTCSVSFAPKNIPVWESHVMARPRHDATGMVCTFARHDSLSAFPSGKIISDSRYHIC
jgi:hypothetical protein